MRDLTIARLHEVLSYEPATGVFRWKVAFGKIRIVGSVAGRVNGKGYRYIWVDGKDYCAHRLAWHYVYGEWPVGKLDHKDCAPDHNWIDNLRPATDSQNSANRRLSKRSTSGFKGVTYENGWVAQIEKDRRHIRLGRFETAEQAHAAYLAAAKTIFGEFARAA